MTMHAIVNRRLNDEIAQIIADYPELGFVDLAVGIDAALADARTIFDNARLDAEADLSRRIDRAQFMAAE